MEVACHAAQNGDLAVLGPLHRATDTLFMRHLSDEAKFLARLAGGGEALAGPVPVASRGEGDRRRVSGSCVDALGELTDRGLNARSQIVSFARAAFERARDQATCD